MDDVMLNDWALILAAGQALGQAADEIIHNIEDIEADELPIYAGRNLNSDAYNRLLRMNRLDRFPEGVLYYKTIRLDTLEKVAKYSFVAHRSINHLDLNLREYSSLREERKVLVRGILFCAADPAYSKKFVNTAEGCRKTQVLDRKYLYSLHLDLAKGREDDVLTFTPDEGKGNWQPKTICFNELCAGDSIYKCSFRRFVEAALKQSGMEINCLRRMMALIKRVLGVRRFSVKSLEDWVLEFLFKSCTDSEIISEFLPILHFKSFVLSNPKQNVLEYLLRHACSSRYDLKLNDSQGKVLNYCFFNSHFKSFELLLKYQNAPFYHGYDSTILIPTWTQDSHNWRPAHLQIPYQKGLMSERRFLLLLQIFHAYNVRNKPPLYGRLGGTLRLLWKSIPDAHFTLEELRKAFEDVPRAKSIVEVVHQYYVKCLAGDLLLGQPRLLKHYCRTAIRKSLCYNFQLPNGVEELPVPPKLQAYLLLDT